MTGAGTVDPVEQEGLRQRNVPVHARSNEEARQAVLQLNALEEKADKKESDKKTFGRTPDGTGMTSNPILEHCPHLCETY